MKNKEHKDLYKKLVDLRININLLVASSIILKRRINGMDRSESRLKEVMNRKVYKAMITKTGQEIRETKLKIRECQRSFGSSE